MCVQCDTKLDTWQVQVKIMLSPDNVIVQQWFCVALIRLHPFNWHLWDWFCNWHSIFRLELFSKMFGCTVTENSMLHNTQANGNRYKINGIVMKSSITFRRIRTKYIIILIAHSVKVKSSKSKRQATENANRCSRCCYCWWSFSPFIVIAKKNVSVYVTRSNLFQLQTLCAFHLIWMRWKFGRNCKWMHQP